MSADLAALLYLGAAILFILSLQGLSSPVSSRRGNQYGMLGMLIAILTAMAQTGSQSWVIAGIAIGGTIGILIAKKIAMTALPQLVAGFHSLVGLAAVFVAAAAFYAPHAFGLGAVGNIHTASLIEMGLGLSGVGLEMGSELKEGPLIADLLF